MATEASRRKRRCGRPEPKPSLGWKLTAVVFRQFFLGLGEVLLAQTQGRRDATPLRPHWEDVVDMNAAAPPLKNNPSAWSHRGTVAVLATLGATIAAYLSLYQLDLISSVWDPVFGQGTERVLTSGVSQDIERVFHVPDALLGALGYVTEIVFAMAGSTRRWQYRPWIIALFALNVLALACVSVALVVTQGVVIKSWCFLCLLTALISFLLVALSAQEVYACLHYLWRVWQRSGHIGVMWDTFWGRASPLADRAALQGE